MLITIKKLILNSIHTFKILHKCFSIKSFNPLIEYKYEKKPISEYSNDFLISKLKQESHYLEKCIKNPFTKIRGTERKNNIILYLSEIRKRKIDENQIIKWSENLLFKYEKWLSEKKAQVDIIKIKNDDSIQPQNIDFYKVSSIRFWENKLIKKSIVEDCLESALLASASSNRQAFRIGLSYNSLKNIKLGGSLNISLFEKAPLRVFIFVNQPNYSEKYACVLDVGMFAQNFILRANEYGLGAVPCYGSEMLSPSQKNWLDYFNLSNDYYCYLSICLGYSKEIAMKPPRRKLKNIIIEKNLT